MSAAEAFLGSPTATFAAQTAVTLVAVVVGASLGAALRSGMETRSQKTETALALFNEFHSPDFIRRRHAVHDALAAVRPGGFTALIARTQSAEEEALYSSVIHFFEKIAILWRRNRLDKRLLAGLLGRYVQVYVPLLFAEDGTDRDDPEWGDLLTTLDATFTEMKRMAT